MTSRLPLSSRSLIVFRPAEQAVLNAQRALEAANTRKSAAYEQQAEVVKQKLHGAASAAVAAEVEASEAGVKHAEAFLATAQERRDERNPTYDLKVPSIPSKSAVNRDLAALGIRTSNNVELVKALAKAASGGAFSGEDAAFITEVSDHIETEGSIPDGSWPRLHELSVVTPGPARIIADRIHFAEMQAWMLVRHHLKLAGQPVPVPEEAMNAIPEEDFYAIANEIQSLLRPSATEVKN